MLGQLGVRSIWCIDLPPGAHQLRLATVHEQSGRGGSMYLDVNVETGRSADPSALLAINQAPKPTAFIDPEAKKLLAGGAQE